MDQDALLYGSRPLPVIPLDRDGVGFETLRELRLHTALLLMILSAVDPANTITREELVEALQEEQEE